MRRKPLRVRHIHSSSRFDRSPASLRKFLRCFSRRVDFFTLTEVNNENRAKALHDISHFDAVRGKGFAGADEVAAMWDFREWRLVDSLSRSLHRVHGLRPVSALFVVLRHVESGQTVLLVVTHFPAGVEGDIGRGNTTPRATAHAQCADNLRRYVNLARARHKPDGVIVTADFNLNAHHRWVKTWADNRFPGLALGWTGTMPKLGTHGPRLIDWTLTNLKVVSAKVLPKNSSSDHRPYIETLEIPLHVPRA